MEPTESNRNIEVPGFVCNRCQQFSPLSRFSQHDAETLRSNSGTVHCPSCGIPAEAQRFRVASGVPPSWQRTG